MKLVNWTRNGQTGFGIVNQRGPSDGYAIDAAGFDSALTIFRLCLLRSYAVMSTEREDAAILAWPSAEMRASA